MTKAHELVGRYLARHLGIAETLQPNFDAMKAGETGRGPWFSRCERELIASLANEEAVALERLPEADELEDRVEELRALSSKAQQPAIIPKVIIALQGGIPQGASANTDVEVQVNDYDTSDYDPPDEIARLGNGTNAYIHRLHTEIEDLTPLEPAAGPHYRRHRR